MKFTRREFLARGAAAGAGALYLGAHPRSAADGSAPGSSPVPSRPNLVLLILDTLRADKLGCYGYGQDTSPEFDALAREGVQFERVISQCPWTRPSCGSLLTSLHPRTLGLYKERDEILSDDFATLPKLLQSAGYATLGMTANPNLNEVFNFNPGFDKYVDSAVVFSWMPKKADSVTRTRGNGLPKAVDLFREALDWAGSKGDRPGYIQINAMEIHEWYASMSVVRPEFQKLFLKTGEKYPAYLQAVRQLTSDVAGFIHTLSAMPGWENTFFVMVSDHGEGLDEHAGLAHSKFHGWLLYESQVVVPWVIYHPTWRPAVKCVSQGVRLLEVMPTLLELLGQPLPEGLHGKSMAPVLLGQRDRVDLPEYFVTETHWRDANKLAAYAADWKFFDNKVTPLGMAQKELQKRGGGERGNLTNMLRNHPEIARPMESFLKDWEATNPMAKAVAQKRAISSEEIQQLEAVGYIQ